MRTVALVLGCCGGLACSVLGLQWFRDAARQSAYPALAALLGQDPWRLELAAYAMLAAFAAGVLGGILAYQNRGRAATALLLGGGILPGLIDPRAFVVTCVLILAGILSLELRPTPTVRFVGARRTSQSLG